MIKSGKIIMDKSLARAVSLDEGNRSMRKGRRKAWNEDDFYVAARLYNRLMDAIEIQGGN